MIDYRQGDILKADAEALVNTVNCVGIMGRGVALQFRNEFPENYAAYRAARDRGEVQPGRMFLVDLCRLQNPRYVINFPTKRHWKGKSRLEDVESGLVALVDVVRERGIRSVAIPPLGCGLGGLSWIDVRQSIEAALQAVPDVQVLVYEPVGAPVAEQMATPKKAPPMTAGRAALQGDGFLLAHPETHARFDRVVQLIDGFETTFGREMLATVHWVASQEGASSPEDAIARV